MRVRSASLAADVSTSLDMTEEVPDMTEEVTDTTEEVPDMTGEVPDATAAELDVSVQVFSSGLPDVSEDRRETSSSTDVRRYMHRLPS